MKEGRKDEKGAEMREDWGWEWNNNIGKDGARRRRSGWLAGGRCEGGGRGGNGEAVGLLASAPRIMVDGWEVGGKGGARSLGW